MTGSTIDLGVLPPAGAAEEEPPAAASRLGWARRWTRWAAGGLGVVVMLTATASAAPGHPWAVPHFSVPAGESSYGRFTLTDKMLYLVDWWETGSEPRLRAYRLSDGTLLWEATADEANVWLDQPALGWYGAEGDVERSAWLDPETGEPRWQGQGSLDAVIGDRLVVSHRQHHPPLEADPRLRSSSLAILDRQTMSEAWRLPPVIGWAYAPGEPGHEDRLVALEDGRLSLYDLATGARLATAEMSPTVPSWPQVYGDVVLVGEEQPSSVSLNAYDLDTLTSLWTLESSDGLLWNLGECAGLLCVQISEGVAAIDPITGEEAWWRPWPPDSTVDVGWLEGHIVVGGLGGTDQQVIDAATGAVVFELGDWQPHHHNGDPALGHLVTRYDSPGRPLTVYGGQTWFARLHLHPARLELLGAVAGGGTWCTTSTRYIACDDRDTVRVWRLAETL